MSDNPLTNISIGQLKRALEITEQIQTLQTELNELLNGGAATSAPRRRGRPPGRRNTPAAAPAKPSVAAKSSRARRPSSASASAARNKAGKAGKRKLSPEGRARIAEAAKKRWANYRAGMGR